MEGHDLKMSLNLRGIYRDGNCNINNREISNREILICMKIYVISNHIILKSSLLNSQMTGVFTSKI
jgi:hypothetical protein